MPIPIDQQSLVCTILPMPWSPRRRSACNEMAARSSALSSTNLSKYQTSNPVARWIIRRFLDQLCARVAALEPNAILDLGCGEGVVARELTRRLPDTRYTGIDLSEEALRTARDLNPGITFHQQSVLDVEPGADRSGSGPLCGGSRTSRAARFCSGAHRRLHGRPRDRLSPLGAVFSPMATCMRGNYVRTWGNHPEHIQAFEPQSLKALLSPHFASVDVETCFPWLIAIGSRSTAAGRGT